MPLRRLSLVTHGVALFVLLDLVACDLLQGHAPPAPPGDVQGWRQSASGKPPTQAEFAAVLAACQDRQKRGRGGSLDQCLGELGLRRVP